jgi:cation:H+ antiporter
VITAVALLGIGTVILAIGAESTVRGAARLSRTRGVSPFVLGALLFGIDVESVGAGVVAAARGQTSIAAGEAFGTIVFLFSAAFGAALLVAPRPIQAPSRTMTLLPAVALFAGAGTLADRFVDRGEGVVLVVLYLVYVGQVLREGRTVRARGESLEREGEEMPRAPWALLLVGGLGLVYVGALLLVDGGIRLVERTTLSAGFVGAAVIGALASADEVFLEVLPVRRGMDALATGNLFGTCAAFASGVLGVLALVRPLTVDSGATTAFLAASVLYTLVAGTFLATGKAGRVVGVLVLGAYGAWLALAPGL